MDNGSSSSSKRANVSSFDHERIEADLRRRHDLAKPLAPGKLSLIAVYSDPDIQDRSHERIQVLNVPIGGVEASVKFVLGFEDKRNWNVFIGLSAFRADLPKTKKPATADCIGVFGLIADCDTDKSKNRSIPIEPTFEINSSPGNYQKAFIFDAPVPLTGAAPVAGALRDATNSDSGTIDLIHVWRIDGTRNWPNWVKVHERERSREPFPVRITAAKFDRRYGTDELHLKLLSATTGAETEDNTTVPRDGETLFATLPLRTQDFIARHVPMGQRSERTFSALCTMVRKGFTDDEIDLIVARFPDGPFSRYRTAKDLDEDIARARTKTAGNRSAANSPPNEPTFAPGQPPNPLKREVRPSAPYPVDALGPILAPAARAIANMVQVPLAIAGSSVLATVSLIASAHGNVSLPSGLTRPISLYMMTVAESGDRKSTADQKAQNAFNRFEYEQMEGYEGALQIHEDELEAWSAARTKITRGRKSVVKKEVAAALRAIEPKPLAPLHPTRRSGDPTLEGLIKHLVDAYPSFGIFTSEGGQFIGGYGLSKDSKTRFVAGLSKFWDGEPVSRLRATEDKRIILTGRRLSIHTLVQPSIAASFINDPVLADQGFLSRFLFCAPESLAGHRPFKRPVQADIETLSDYDRRIRELLHVPPKMKEGTRNVLDPPEIRMTEEAERLWIEFHDDNEKKLVKSAMNALVKAFANKLPEQAGRIAANLALARGLERSVHDGQTYYNWPKIEVDDMAGAIELARYHLDEVLRFVEVGAPDQELEDAAALLEWMRKRAARLMAGGDPNHIAHHVALAEVYQKGPRRFRKRAEAARSMAVLLNEGYVRRAVHPVYYGKYPYRDAYRLRTEPWD
jgi:hypothetical protein